jgi:uncharacterized membrane protein
MKMRTPAKIILTAITICSALALAACPERKSIADIQADPGKYQDKEVAIAGRVVDSYGLSIPGTSVGGGAYKIDDGTGSMWIVVSDGAVPSKGAEIGVKGRISSGVSWKGRNYGLGMHESDRRYRRR